MTVRPIPARVSEITRLEKGTHAPDHTYCVMEAVAYVAGEPWSDHPPCVSPVLVDPAILINDSSPDDVRQRLIPLVPLMVGTSRDGHDVARAMIAADYAVRVFAAIALDAAGIEDHASQLRSLPRITDPGAAKAANDAARAARAASYAASAARMASYAANAASAANDAASAARAASYAASDAASAARAASYAASDAANAANDAVWSYAIRMLADMIDPPSATDPLLP